MFGQAKETTKMTQILDTVISKSKEISYYSSTVNWDSLSTKMYLSSKGATTVDELKPAFEILFNELRDHHGMVRKLTDYSLIANLTDHKNSRNIDNREFDAKTWAIVNDTEARFEYDILQDNIGYLKIVGVGPNVDGQAEAERIRDALIEIQKKDINEWIVDLRYNGGGNINVMLAGIAPLLDTKNVVNIIGEKEDTQLSANVKKGNFWYGGLNVFKLKNKPVIHHPKIAVLTSRWTWSSGEFVAVAFKGQENTKFFGESTGGYTTNNSWEIINNEIVLIMSTGIYADRNGNKYGKNVEPDVKVDFKVETDKEKDQGIIEASQWLKE